MTSTPSVLAVGSCRIFRPLRRLHDEGLINLVNYHDRFWFTHTAAAARQYVDVMQGRKDIPYDLRSAALESDLNWPENMALGLPKADVVMVEVSSLKGPSLGEYQLNAHKIYGLSVAAGVDHRPVASGNTEALPEGHVLKGMQVAYSTHDELVADLTAIRDSTGLPVVLVDHLYSLTPDGEPAPERVRLTDELRGVESETGMPLHSTRDLILQRGVDIALLDQNHYRSDFEIEVGRSLLPTISKVHSKTDPL